MFFFDADTVKDEIIPKKTDTIHEAARQINDYLNGKLKTFSLPLAPEGTEFMKQVWNELRKIPFGETVCYKDIAEKIGKPNACRAVGLANNKNPIPIIIPCHRVIGKNGKLVGFRGGLDIKGKLLALETQSELVLSAKD